MKVNLNKELSKQMLFKQKYRDSKWIYILGNTLHYMILLLEHVTDFENVTNLAREISKLFKNLINEEFWLIQNSNRFITNTKICYLLISFEDD